ncbi:MAG: hypothetical protein AAF720_15555 [Pseudomonadota bacterium]
MNELKEKIEKAVAFEMMTTKDMNGAFALIASGHELAKTSKRPDIAVLSAQSGQLQSGVLIVYLFAMWDQYFDHADVPTYFRPEEQRTFYAYKHIRHVFAHNIQGNRAGNRKNQERIDRAKELDDVQTSDKPLQGVTTSKDKIELQFPDAFLGCQNFLVAMAQKLAAGRFSVGGPEGKIRSSNGQTDVM